MSFDASISVTSFNELSGSVFSWLEEYCKPQVSCQLLSNVTCLLKTSQRVPVTKTASYLVFCIVKSHMQRCH